MGLFNKIKSVFSKDKEAQKYDEALTKTRKEFSTELSALSKKYKNIDDDYFEELENILIMADIGVDTVMKFVDKLKNRTKEENIKNAETLKGYEEKSGDELHKVYFSVQTSVRNYNKKVEANTAETINLEIVNDSVPLTPKETIQKILNGYLTNGDIAYVEWKEIKVLLGDFIVSIDGKMKELAKEELDRAIEEREELNKIIAELEEQAK